MSHLSVFKNFWESSLKHKMRYMYLMMSKKKMERSGSVVECLTWDRRATGSSFTGVIALWSLSKTHLSRLSTGSTQEDPSLYNWKIVDGT